MGGSKRNLREPLSQEAAEGCGKSRALAESSNWAVRVESPFDSIAPPPHACSIPQSSPEGCELGHVFPVMHATLKSYELVKTCHR
jgi:hypothetical protein